MTELYEITAGEIISELADRVIYNNPGMTKKKAKNLVCNALCYNIVVEEILNQVDFLMDKEDKNYEVC